MAKLYFRYACMNSGKSAEVLQINFHYSQVDGKNGELFISSKDTRSKGMISSRLGISAPAIQFNEDENLFDLIKKIHEEKNLTYVIFDECSLLTAKQVDQLGDVVDYLNIDVFCYGLLSDINRELFEGSNRLIVLADEIESTSIKALCWCGEKAINHARIEDGVFIEGGEAVVIDDESNRKKKNMIYVALCRKHHKEKKWKKE